MKGLFLKTPNAIIDGVWIELTEDQLKTIDKEIAKRKRASYKLTSILTHFGFRKVNTSDWKTKKSNSLST